MTAESVHALWDDCLCTGHEHVHAVYKRLYVTGYVPQAVQDVAACMWAAATSAATVLLTHVMKSKSKVLHCRGGLEGRLLGLTLQAEHPQLETQCSALLQNQEEQRLELAALDNHLLQSLATSKVRVHTLCGRHEA